LRGIAMSIGRQSAAQISRSSGFPATWQFPLTLCIEEYFFVEVLVVRHGEAVASKLR
jgi:hypothetical protein